jgi:hypothetical protein
MSQVSNLKLQQQNHKNVYEIIRITKLGLLFFTKKGCVQMMPPTHSNHNMNTSKN